MNDWRKIVYAIIKQESMKKLIFTMAVAACFAAAQAQTNEKRGSINLWGYVVDSFLQTGLEGAKVTLMTADSTVVDSIRTYPYDSKEC